MKAKRRQELKTNDLAQWLEDMRISFNEWGVYVVLGIAFVVVVAVVLTYRGSAKQDAIQQSYARLSNLSEIAPQGMRKSDDELRQALVEMGEIAALSDDRNFKLDVIARRGEIGLLLAENTESGIIDKEYLGDARGAFQAIADGYPDRTIHFGRALMGLFQIEADLFAVDGDMAHKVEAKRHLEQLRDHEKLRGTPLQTKAVDLLNDLDAMFTTVTLPSRPAPIMPTPIAVAPRASVGTASPEVPSDTTPPAEPVESADGGATDEVDGESNAASVPGDIGTSS